METVDDIVHKRLDDHDKDRIALQNSLENIRTKLLDEIDKLEEKISSELEENFRKTDEIQQEFIQNKANNKVKGGENFITYEYSIVQFNDKREIWNKIALKKDEVKYNGDEDVDVLRAFADQHQTDKVKAGEELTRICNGFREDVKILEQNINSQLENKFNEEDKRLQSLLSGDLDENTVRAHLITGQKYIISENRTCTKITDRYEIEVKLEFYISDAVKRISVKEVKNDKIYLSNTLFNKEEQKLLTDSGLIGNIFIRVSHWVGDLEPQNNETYRIKIDDTTIPFNDFCVESLYTIKFEIVYKVTNIFFGGYIKFTTPKFDLCCFWKECTDDIDSDKKYFVDENNGRIVTKKSRGYKYSTIFAKPFLPHNKIISWSIKILKAQNNKGSAVIGVAPFDISQNGKGNFNSSGWYFDCYNSTLRSGPPHNYDGKEYGPRKVYGQYIHEGDTVGVIIDTSNGDLSFAVNGVNYGVAYEGIPLDKPFVPCVLLYYEGDSVELNLSEVKENLDVSIPTPSNITAQSDLTWDSITLTWDAVDGAEFYQIKTNDKKCWDTITAKVNKFIVRGFLPETENSVRVRTVKDGKVSEWSDVVKGRTAKMAEFSECVWRECPDDVDEGKKYSAGKDSSKIATKIDGDDNIRCVIIGNTPLPSDKVTSWHIKILKSKRNDGGGIYIGVAPFDINQNGGNNAVSYGWYFNCYNSHLYSGNPHKNNSEYGPKKGQGNYVHTKDKIGVVMNTKNGNLLYSVSNYSNGIAYEDIPLDKPLVISVLLENKGDSVELDLSEVKDSELRQLENASKEDEKKSETKTQSAAKTSTTETKKVNSEDPDKGCIIS